MRILMIGAGGVGDAAARIAVERDFFEAFVVADYDPDRARATVDAAVARREGESRFVAAQVDASDEDAVATLAREQRATHVLNAVDPRFVMPIFNGAFAAGAHYVDMAMSLSQRHPSEPYSRVGVKLGDEQFAQDERWEEAGRLALLGMGVEPGLSDVFAKYAADHLFSHIDELGTPDGANLVIRDVDGNGVSAAGRPAGWPSAAGVWSRACPTCSRSMRRPTRSPTSPSSARVTGPISSSATRTATRCSRRGSRCGRSSRSASTPLSSGSVLAS